MISFVRIRTGNLILGSTLLRPIHCSIARKVALSMACPKQVPDTELKNDSASDNYAASSEKPLALPALPSIEGGIKMDLSSGNASVRLDHLGPIVVGIDGTISRISNWDQMTEMEQKNTLRIISKRNQVRIEARRAEVKAEVEGDEPVTS